MKFETKEFEEKMKKSIASYVENLSGVRAGRANPDVLKKINVDYYGSPTAISAIAEIKVTDARTITITAWDKSAMKGIEKAILTSDLGINPQNDGSCIRLSFPPTTEERRRELSKQVSKLGEDAKVAIRNIRRDANDKIKAMKKNSELTEDEAKTGDKNVQDLTDKYIKEIDKITADKTREDLEAEWKEKCASPIDAAEKGDIDDVIAADELRQRICAAFGMLFAKADAKPTRRHVNLPL